MDNALCPAQCTFSRVVPESCTNYLLWLEEPCLRECTMLYTAVRSFILHGPRIVNKNHLKSLLGYLIIDIAQRKETIYDLIKQAEKEA